MRRKVAAAAGAAVLLGALALPIGAAELTLDLYFDVTVARLELIATSWETTGAPPEEQQEADLFTSHGTTSEAYLAYAGGHHAEIDDRLANDDALRQDIAALVTRIDQAIAQTEAQP